MLVPVNNPRRRDPFDPFGFFGNRNEQRQLALASDSVAVQCLPLPRENAPANFNGAVGSYTMTVTAGPTNVTEGDLDETVGLVHVKQVFEIPHPEHAGTRLGDVAQPVAVVPSTLDGDALMAQVRANGLQTALVADEYGGIAGMVTVEDLIEEIVGDIRDEHDEPAPRPTP